MLSDDCVEGVELVGPHDHPEVSMHTHSLAEYMKCINQDDWNGVGDDASAHKLAQIGAKFLIAPTTQFTRPLLTSSRNHRCPGCTLSTASPTRP